MVMTGRCLVDAHEGTASGGIVVGQVIAFILEVVGTRLEHVELGAGVFVRVAGLLPLDLGGGGRADVVAAVAVAFLHEFLDVFVVLSVASRVLDLELVTVGGRTSSGDVIAVSVVDAGGGGNTVLGVVVLHAVLGTH